MKKQVMIGNALSVMVAAKALADQGQEVILVNGSKSWGGHFSALQFGEHRFDAGMVLHEFTSFNMNAIADIDTYDPSIRNDAGRFSDTVKAYVAQYQTTHQVDEIKMLVNGKIYDDMMIANHLQALNQLPNAARIKTDLQAICNQADQPLHAKYKGQAAEFEGYALSEVSIANHGKYLHEQLIEPFCQKLFNCSTSKVSAYYHRVPWLPLFYPETLHSYFTASPQDLPATEFSYPSGEQVGDLAAKLQSIILAHPNITVINEQPEKVCQYQSGYKISFKHHPQITTEQLAWSGSLSQLLLLTDNAHQVQHYEKASLVLLFVTVPVGMMATSFSVLTIPDPDYLTYRITDQSYCAKQETASHKLVIELNADLMAAKQQQDSDVLAFVNAELIKMGVLASQATLNVIKQINMNQALPLASFANIEAFKTERHVVDTMFPEVQLLGAASGFSSSSFNHQIIQGLKLARDWSSHHGPKKANVRDDSRELSCE